MKKLLLTLLILSSSLLVFSQGLWTQKASLPDTGRGYGIGFSIGNYGYVGLGYNIEYNKSFHDFWQYNPANNTWTRKADFPGHATTSPSTFVIGNNAYLVTGSEDPTGNKNYKECWEYNSISNTWTKKSEFPGTSRVWAAGFAIGGKCYIGTGFDSAYNEFNDFWEYDTAGNSWTQLANFPGSKRYACNGFAVNGKGYLCFGFTTTDGNPLKEIWQYDTGTQIWTQKTSCLDSFAGGAGFVIGNNIYCGCSSSNYQDNTFWKYNTLTDFWTKQANFIGKAGGIYSAFSVLDSGYLGFGLRADSNFDYNDLYKFYPDTTTSINKIKNPENKVIIFPNPFSKTCSIIVNEEKPVFSLYDISGKKEEIDIEKVDKNIYSLNRGNLSEGVYILQIEFFQQFICIKLIIINN